MRPWEAVWYFKGGSMTLATNARTPGGAYRRLYTVHRRLMDSGNVQYLSVRHQRYGW